METGFDYFGARYYDSDISIWLSVVPIAIGTLADKYPSMSPYMYCAGNPVMLVDPDGKEFEDPDDEILARKSYDRASLEIFENNCRIRELKKNRKNLSKEEKSELKEKKRMVKILERHKKNLEEMINTKKIKYRYIERPEGRKTLETYVRNGKVMMEFIEGLYEKQAHEEAHGHQYLTGELKINRYGGDNESYSDLSDEAKAYQVEYCYKTPLQRANFIMHLNVDVNDNVIDIFKSVRDIVPNNLVKTKVFNEYYPGLVAKHF